MLNLSELLRLSSQEFELFLELNGGGESENDVKHSLVAKFGFSEGLEESHGKILVLVIPKGGGFNGDMLLEQSNKVLLEVVED